MAKSPRDGLIRTRRPGLWMAGLIALTILILWEWGVQTENIASLYFPAPTTILQALARQIRSGALATDLFSSLGRMALGVLIGGGVGLVLGLLLGWLPGLRMVIEPFVAATHPLPKIAVLPLVMVIFGVNSLSLVVVTAAGAFFPMLINTIHGVTQIHPLHFDVARNYNAQLWKVFQRVILPGSLPAILAGARLALNTSLLLVVAAEMVMSRNGLGALILMGWNTLRTEDIFAALLVITLLGLMINLLVNLLSRWLVPWQSENSIS